MGGSKNTHISAKNTYDFRRISNIGNIAQFHINTVPFNYQMSIEIEYYILMMNTSMI